MDMNEYIGEKSFQGMKGCEKRQFFNKRFF